MEKKCSDNRNGGFSLVEMLAVVAILVILLGVSMVAAAGYRDMLKITELDNAAREIYMAAENRAVLLSGAKRLSHQVGKASGQPVTLTEHGHSDGENLYYVSKTDVASEANMTEGLLTTGSIDPELMKGKGDFYIVYDQDSGSVTDVFYAESSMDSLMTDGFDKFYDDWAKSRSERLKQKNVMLVGWYNGEAAEGEDVKLDIPKEPTIKVTIDNGEELTVTVEYTAPAPAELSVKLGNIELTDGTYDTRKRDIKGQKGANGTAYTCTWVLDSLTAGKKFQELGSTGVTPGENFTVTATITSPDSAFPEASASDTNNSLFQEGSGLVTDEDGKQVRVCYIRTLRHLQNLDHSSGVPEDDTDAKIRAVQTENILGDGGEVYPDYKFIPIFNPCITEYRVHVPKAEDSEAEDPKADGGYEIWNLCVEDHQGNAGLFSELKNAELSGIRLVNATVKTKNGSAGALAGEAENTVIQNCWVYWELDETLKAELIEDAANNKYNYQITGTNAGGLVGHAQGGCTITTSLAATLVSGTDCAGGLIGQFDGDTATVKYSYADCYLTGTGTGDASKAAGLVGEVVKEKKVTLLNCYAAGFIVDGSSAAGLCLGEGTTDATNAYTVVRRIGSGDFAPLTGDPKTDKFKNTYFLEAKDWTGEESSLSGVTKLSFTEMLDTSDKMDAITGDAGAFQWKTSADDQSHPYNLRMDRGIELKVYDYPGLKGLPHYGDWTSDFKGTSLVYYEEYKDGSLGVAGGNINTLKNDRTVVSDGYAVLCRAEDLTGQTEVSIEYIWSEDGVMEGKTGTSTYSKGSLGFTDDTKRPDYIVWKNPDGQDVHLYLFLKPEPDGFDTDTLSNSAVRESSFYRYLNASVKAGSGTNAVEMSTRAFYNPHFAETVVPITANYGSITTDNVKGLADTLAKNLTEIKVRTPRHLYDLSHFEAYYTRRNVFRQILPLEYSTYDGYNGLLQKTEDGKPLDGKPFVQQPIGSGAAHFKGTYDGDCNVIKNVVFKTEDRYAGLFGYSEGTLRDIVYELDPKYPVDASLDNSTGYVGALAGANGGTVDNCAVYGLDLRANVSGGTLYLGGLAGWNSGTIRSSAAQSAGLTVNCFSYAKVYVGGLMGENDSNGVVTTSYAVARMNTEVDATARAARICGFVGWNSGSIYNSYAAADLSAGGERVDTCGFCGERAGRQSGNAYLDRGNFSYYGTAYAASYQRDGDKAASTPYAELTAKEKATAMGMGTVWTGDAPDPGVEYPYPAAVKNAAGEYVHYGQWPVPMPLGEMGVFYWEKMVDASDSKSNPTYHMSALAVDAQGKTITRQTTLSEAHDDGRVVIEYGYGYYANKDVGENVSFSAKGIGYFTYGVDGTGYASGDAIYNADGKPLHANEGVTSKDLPIESSLSGSNGAAEDLKNQMKASGEYEFYCWTSYHEGGRPSVLSGEDNDDRRKWATHGLALSGTGNQTKQPGNGTFTLTQTSGANAVSVEFGINPLFADSMSVNNTGGLTPVGVSTDMPGTKGGEKGNPFKIRCGIQLQQINWMNNAWVDTTIGRFVAQRFPYLTGKDEGQVEYFWEQTHDIDWVAEGNTYDSRTSGMGTGVFMSIAQIEVDSNGNVPGWFGGSYDGQNYTIKNLNVGKNAGYQPNGMGLFGYVKGATLKNMVLYSEGGTDIITVEGRKLGDGEFSHRSQAPHAWYAGGVLAGVALKGDDDEGAINNCSVAGYTIQDKTNRGRCLDFERRPWTAYYDASKYDMSGAIGGLVGMTDMPLEGCTASAKIEIDCNHKHVWIGTTNDESMVPVRVGGLVGSTTSTVTNCYTGGTIDISGASNASIYAGRLIGGVGAEPLGIAGDTAKVENCYSYLTLPEKKGVVKGVYNIGGTERDNSTGTVDLGNNYYLSGKAGGANAQEQAVTHRQLAGQTLIDGQTIYEKLTAYSPVSTQVDGLDAPGRFSYAPKNRLDLQGRDYPFPTILTMDGYKVHYGAWPPQGIVRPGGGGPIELDMFAGNGTCRKHDEKLTLSEDLKGGTWSAEVSDESVVELKEIITQDGQLTVTVKVEAQKASDTPVTVTVKYTIGDVEYSLPITVYVDDAVELHPGAAGIFPNDVVTVPLTAYGKTRPGEQTYDDTPLTAGTLTLVKAERVDGPVTAEADGLNVELTRGGEETAQTQQWVEVTYTYEKDGYTSQEKTHRLAAELLTLPKGVWSEDGLTWTMDFKDYKVEKLTAELADTALTGFTADPDGTGTETAVTLTKEADAKFPEDGVELKVTLTVPDEYVPDGIKHDLTITVPPKPETGEGT